MQVGSYIVRIEGLDMEIRSIYTGTSTTNVDVETNITNGPVTVVLNQRPPAMLIWVGLEPGGCDRAEIVNIVSRVYENGISLVYDETIDCYERLENGLLIAGLSETSTYDVSIRGLNSNSEYTHEYNEDDITVAFGAPTDIAAMLFECMGICDEP